MKKFTLGLLSLVVLAGTSFAGQSTVSSSKDYKSYKQEAAAPTCFSDVELQLDTYATYKFAHNGNYFGDGWGGGIGLNYFFQRYVGVGIEGSWDGTGPNDTVIHHTNASLILRLPIDSICLAPYLLGGGGYSFDGEPKAAGFAGGGLEYRVVPHKVGIFADGRYTWTENANDYGLVRAGVRFVF